MSLVQAWITLKPVTDDLPLFQSFFMGGFECATHRRLDRTRIDVIAHTQHDRFCKEDYRLLRQAGIRTVRDGLRWHLIEKHPGHYDWSSFLPMLRAALETGTQVLWDLCHWGVPEDIDPLAPDFPGRFADFAAAAVHLIQKENSEKGISLPQIYCPINEISFWSWVGGDEERFHPFGRGSGQELKRQLVLASRMAIQAIRSVDATARFLQAEPMIHISAADERPEDKAIALHHNASQFEAWDMLAGVKDPELGGSIESLDLIGVNYYWNNQWIHEGERTPLGHHLHCPLHEQLISLWKRYGRPILISETGAESSAAAGWLGLIAAEVRQARRVGVPVLGVCVYPAMDYPGWDDDRHCSVGLIESASDWKTRRLREDFAAELRLQAGLLTDRSDL